MKNNALSEHFFIFFLLGVIKRRIIRKILLYKLKENKLFMSTNIETYGYCNRKCFFCFNSDRFPKREIGIMGERIWKKIIDELSSINFAGRISPYFYGEPLLDKRLASLIEYARDKCPNALIQINTNGDVLNENLLKKLIKSGVDKFLITDYAKIPQKKLRDLQKKYPYWIILRTQTEFPKQNRGGIIFQKQNINLIEPCLRPSSQLVINWKGQVLLCCNDYYAKYCFGDVKKHTILEIWYSDNFTKMRKKLKEKGARQQFTICRQCDMPPSSAL